MSVKRNFSNELPSNKILPDEIYFIKNILIIIVISAIPHMIFISL